MKKKKLLTIFAFITSALALNAKILLPDIISDHMVLQQQTDAKLWGWTNPDDNVIIETDWDINKQVKADDKGFWEITITTPKATDQPYSIFIRDSDSEVFLSDVLIGEVWFCSGQSNMEMPLRGFPGQPVENSLETIVTSGNYPTIRMANVGHRRSYTPQEKVDGKWLESNPKNAADFSALGYFFARRLNDILHVPIGIINCAYGGSKVEGWLPEWKLKEYPEINIQKEKDTPDSILKSWERINVMYNAMLHPLTRYTIRGFTWNQGEANVGRHKQYASHLADMVGIWRDEWNLGQLPFYSVEIPAWHYNDPNGTSAALLREAQRESAKIIPNSKIVSTVDLIYPHEYYDIHGSKKKEIGDRLAYVALSDTYGIAGIPSEYPTFDTIKINGNTAELKFINARGGLSPHYDIKGFEAADSNGKFYQAKASADKDSKIITVTCDSIDKIESVRYCFKNFAIGELHSTTGLPLMPFRTDKWSK